MPHHIISHAKIVAIQRHSGYRSFKSEVDTNIIRGNGEFGAQVLGVRKLQIHGIAQKRLCEYTT